MRKVLKCVTAALYFLRQEPFINEYMKKKSYRFRSVWKSFERWDTMSSTYIIPSHTIKGWVPLSCYNIKLTKVIIIIKNTSSSLFCFVFLKDWEEYQLITTFLGCGLKRSTLITRYYFYLKDTLANQQTFLPLTFTAEWWPSSIYNRFDITLKFTLTD